MNMTYEEILERNRNSRKGTFVDRSWKVKQENILLRTDVSRWEKFTSGGYNLKNLGDRAALDIVQK